MPGAGDEDGQAKRFKIYTRTGDSGTSSLYNGQRLPKDDVYFEALGNVDELNSAIGLAREFCNGEERHTNISSQLEEIQSRLLDVGSAVATPLASSSEFKVNRTRLGTHHTAAVESWIDAFDSELPPLRHFILPSGGLVAAHLHMARSICRRAERSCVPLGRQECIDPDVVVYLNRLSDYLFTAARYAALKDGKPEVTYQKGPVEA